MIGSILRSSSRFCLGVEHGDYNGTELFGVGTDRFIWLAFNANTSGKIRLFSGNFPDDGVVEFHPGQTPEPRSPEIADTWARFPFGVDHVLRRNGLPPSRGADDFKLVSLDTGTIRPGLEKSTYRVRRAECDELVSMLRGEFGTTCLAEIRSRGLYHQILERHAEEHPDLCDRLSFIFEAQNRFAAMLEAWRSGDMVTVGKVFRADGIGLRDQYRISGPELESMCDIARSVPGDLGERMLGGGDKGAAGAIVRSRSVNALATAVETGYPRSHPSFAENFAVQVCGLVDGITTLDGTLGSEPR